MNRNRCKVVIIEQSELLIKGLEHILNCSSIFAIDNIWGELPMHVDDSIDIVIINPSLVSQSRRTKVRELFPTARIIAMLYSYVDRDTLKLFDDIIEINHNSAKILHTLENSIRRDNLGGAESNMDELSDREKEILIAVAKGLMNKEIASLHNISIHTVMSHRKNISRKTQIRTVSGLLVYALLNNLIDETEVLK